MLSRLRKMVSLTISQIMTVLACLKQLKSPTSLSSQTSSKHLLTGTLPHLSNPTTQSQRQEMWSWLVYLSVRFPSFSHKGLSLLFLPALRSSDWARDCRFSFLSLIPGFSDHIYGLVVVLHGSLYMDLPLVILPKFTLPAFCDSISRFRVSILFVVPPMIVMLVKQDVSQYDLSCVRLTM